MRPSRRGRRRRWFAPCGAMLVLMLSGCFVYDAAKPTIRYQNLTDRVLVVTIEGIENPTSQNVAPIATPTEVVIRECIGTSLAVETDDGLPIGEVDQPACPGWLLTIDEDYSLTYEEG